MWEFGCQVWEQDQDSGNFNLVKIGEFAFTFPLAHLPLAQIYAAKRHPPGAQSCALAHFKLSNGASASQAACYPAEFDFCPSCGVPLEGLPVDEPNPLWLPPFGANDNNRLFKLAAPAHLSASKSDPLLLEPAPAPFAGELHTRTPHWLVARLGARQRALYALAPDDGRLALCNHGAQPCAWFVFEGSVGATDLPPWAYGVTLNHDESHLALPTEEGLAWLSIDWGCWSKAGPQLRIAHQRARCLAAPAVLRPGAPGTEAGAKDLICAPVLDSSAAPQLLWRRSGDTSGTWSSVALPADVPAAALRAGHWGQAVRTATGTLVWPGKHGYLRVKHSPSADAPQPSWHPFAPTYEGLPELGACWREGHAAWLACRVSQTGIGGRVEPSVSLVALDAGGGHEEKPCECGEFFSTGAASFSFAHNHWKTPDVVAHVDEEESTLRLPLLQWAQNAGDLAPWVLLAQFKPPADEYSIYTWLRKPVGGALRLLLRDGNHPEVALRPTGAAALGTHNPTQIHVCWFDGHLWLHLPERGGVLRCRFECRPSAS